MKVEIRNRWTNEIIIEGEYENIRDCLEKNRNADLSNANLYDADLSNANLYNANLYDANLSNADLYKADLRFANLSNANLSNADLYKAKISITQKDVLLAALHIEIKEEN